MSGVPPEELRYASGLFNLMRNLGGAIGIAAVTAWLQDYGRIHGERFGEALAHANTSGLSKAVSRLSAVTPDGVHAHMLVQGEIGHLVVQRALSQAFQDVFFLIALIFAAALVVVPFCRAMIFSDAPLVESH